MTISVAQQAAALAQAAALGLAVGLLYDLFRVLRVRVALPLLGAVLDLSFWIIVTVALFVWSQQAWRGEIRLYGIFFLFGGGVLYFWLISTWMLKIGYFLADAAALVWRILTPVSYTHLLRPRMTAWPRVRALKRFRSWER